MNSSSDYPDIVTTVTHSSLPEMIFLCIPETTHEQRVLIGLLLKQCMLLADVLCFKLTLPDYRYQIGRELTQMSYEYIHFLGLGVPKIIDCYREKGLISKTPIPRYSQGWWGRIALSFSDTLLGYHVRTKGIWVIIYDVGSVLDLNSDTPNYILGLTISSLYGKLIYGLIVKPADLLSADRVIKKQLYYTN
ncbi:MAG TPA: hypothetical protein PLW93_05095 [Candidatus Absconditabacterales bacterium]|nr:hypothetical protein [Candidatus Absconditabacterales bacterium]HNG97619.1 hypothetical protein [Candidatus Absconditabacterales bacterium]